MVSLVAHRTFIRRDVTPLIQRVTDFDPSQGDQPEKVIEAIITKGISNLGPIVPNRETPGQGKGPKRGAGKAGRKLYLARNR